MYFIIFIKKIIYFDLIKGKIILLKIRNTYKKLCLLL